MVRNKNARFHLTGNRLAVDFANTVRSPLSPREALRDWADVVDFLVATHVLPSSQAGPIQALAVQDPAAAGRACVAARELRDGIRAAVELIASGQHIPAETIESINRVLRWTEGYDQLVPAAEGRWVIGFVPREQQPEWLLAPIARSAAEIVAEGPAAPVRRCANPACILYFYDDSRTGGRRWCSMAACGNRSKAAAHAARARRRKRKRKR